LVRSWARREWPFSRTASTVQDGMRLGKDDSSVAALLRWRK
jgi:hypothetical protein